MMISQKYLQISFTVNPMPIYATGTDKAVYEVAGADMLLAEQDKIGELARGDIAVTPCVSACRRQNSKFHSPRWRGSILLHIIRK